MPQAIINSYITTPGVLSPPLTDLILWFSADSGVTSGGSAPSDGSPVDLWTERVAGVANAAQATAAWQPTYRTAQINGYPVVRFDPTTITSNFSQHLQIPNANCPAEFAGIGTGEYSIFAVYRPANFTNQHYLLTKGPNPGGNTNSQIPVLQLQSTSGNIAIATGNNVAVSSSGPTAATWSRIGISRSQSGAAIYYYLDGVQYDSDSLLSGAGNNTEPCYMGARRDGDSLGDTGAAGMNGDLAEMLVYNFAYTDTASIAAVDAYFTSKYAL